MTPLHMKVGSVTGNDQLTRNDRRVKGADDKAKQGKDKQGQDLLKRLIQQTAMIAGNEPRIQATVSSFVYYLFCLAPPPVK